MKIINLRRSETGEYAAQELGKYIRKLTDCEIMPEIETAESLPDEIGPDCLVLGLLEQLGLDASDVQDAMIDDVLDIRVENCSGYLAGSNDRSILMSVYRYCVSAGCRFIRPGENGEVIPYCDLRSHSFVYRKKADYPFRGECCEGAISYEHMRDTVYWLPKIGMNLYMIEGLVPYSYMHKWYGHIGNPFLRQKGQVTDYAFLEKQVDKLEKDIKKTGLQLHTIGHGWMFEKLGIHHTNEKEEKAALRDEDRQYLAQVKGVRGINRSTFYTHFCYSNPAARKILVDFCVEYAQKKPYVDFLHVWLADSKDNQCECPECIRMTPSDHYVQLLNEIDEALTAIGSDMRLVMILYVDTVRPPEKLRLKNPGRFVMLAAIGLHYEKGYVNEPYTGVVPPFVRNHFTPPDNALRLQWHREWKAMCGNPPSLIYEYRYYTDMYCDPGYQRVARETYRDMRALDSVSFQGCMSDQTHRMYLPTALPLAVMGATLFDRDLDLEAFSQDWFRGEFGADSEKCRQYLQTLSDLFCPANLRAAGKTGVEEDGLATGGNAPKTWLRNPEVAEKVKKVPAVLEAFLPTIEKNMTLENACQRNSWTYLRYHSRICSRLWKVVYLGALGQMDEAGKEMEALERYLAGVEEEIHPVFDVFLFCKTFRAKLGMKQHPYND